MKRKMWFLPISTILQVIAVGGYPDGAPASACRSMKPGTQELRSREKSPKRTNRRSYKNIALEKVVRLGLKNGALLELSLFGLFSWRQEMNLYSFHSHKFVLSLSFNL